MNLLFLTVSVIFALVFIALITVITLEHNIMAMGILHDAKSFFGYNLFLLYAVEHIPLEHNTGIKGG